MLAWNIKILATPEAMGPDELEFLPVFSSELSKSAVNYAKASRTEDRDEAVRLCHRMRGSASVFGFKLLAEILLKAECLILSDKLLPSSIEVEVTAVAAEVEVLTRAGATAR